MACFEVSRRELARSIMTNLLRHDVLSVSRVNSSGSSSQLTPLCLLPGCNRLSVRRVQTSTIHGHCRRDQHTCKGAVELTQRQPVRAHVCFPVHLSRPFCSPARDPRGDGHAASGCDCCGWRAHERRHAGYYRPCVWWSQSLPAGGRNAGADLRALAHRAPARCLPLQVPQLL